MIIDFSIFERIESVSKKCILFFPINLFHAQKIETLFES